MKGPGTGPLSWTVALLPFYEQGALYNAVNFAADRRRSPNLLHGLLRQDRHADLSFGEPKVGPWIPRTW